MISRSHAEGDGEASAVCGACSMSAAGISAAVSTRSTAPVSMALQAGMMEESLFRAVPLAGAALIGRRFGRASTHDGIRRAAARLIFCRGTTGAAERGAPAPHEMQRRPT